MANPAAAALALYGRLPPIQESEFTEKVKIAEGGFAIVYKARWGSRGVVAIKELREANVGPLHQEAIEEVRKEAEFMELASQCNEIVRIYGVVVRNLSLTAIVMEFMPRGSLDKVLKNLAIPLSLYRRFQIALDICKGLAFLHRNKIAHRDVKSLNVLLDDNYHAKVADLGEATIRALTPDYRAQTIRVRGTVLWMAPEVLDRRVNTIASDVYSYGWVLWELLTRQFPYPNVQDIFEIQDRIKKGVKENIPACPAIFKDVIESCWNMDPEKRPTTKSVLELFGVFIAEAEENRIVLKIDCEYSEHKIVDLSLGKTRDQTLLDKGFDEFTHAKEKPYEIIFAHCHALDIQNLRPFLHQGLRVLKIIECPNVKLGDIQKLATGMSLLVQRQEAGRVSFLFQGSHPELFGSALNLYDQWAKDLNESPLEEIVFCDSTTLNARALQAFLHDRLQKLTLDGCSKIDNDALMVIKEKCPLLLELTIRRCSGLRQIKGKKDKALTLPLLEVLRIEDCESLREVEIRPSSIQQIIISNCPNVSRVVLATNRLPLWIVDREMTHSVTPVNFYLMPDDYKARVSFDKAIKLGDSKILYNAGRSSFWALSSYITQASLAGYAPALFYEGVYKLTNCDSSEAKLKATVELFRRSFDANYLAAGCALRVLAPVDKESMRRLDQNIVEKIDSVTYLELSQSLLDLNFALSGWGWSKDPYTLCLRGEVYFLLGDYVRALNDLFEGLRLATQAKKENLRAFALLRVTEILGLFYPSEQVVRQMTDVLAKASLSNYLDVRELEAPFLDLHRAQKQWLDGNSEAALAIIDPLLTQEDKEGQSLQKELPGSTLAFLYLCRGDIHRSMGSYDKALEDFTSACQNNPQSFLPLAKRAEILFLLGRFNEAKGDIKNAIRLSPRNIFALRLEKLHSQINENYDHDLKILNDIWAKEPKRTFALALRCNYYYSKRRHNSARLDLFTSSNIDSTYAFVRTIMKDEANQGPVHDATINQMALSRLPPASPSLAISVAVPPIIMRQKEAALLATEGEIAEQAELLAIAERQEEERLQQVKMRLAEQIEMQRQTLNSLLATQGQEVPVVVDDPLNPQTAVPSILSLRERLQNEIHAMERQIERFGAEIQRLEQLARQYSK